MLLTSGEITGRGGDLRLAVRDFLLAAAQLQLKPAEFPFAGVELKSVLGELLFGGLQLLLTLGELAGGRGDLRLAVRDFLLPYAQLLLELAEFPFAGVECQAVLCELLFGSLQLVLTLGKLAGGGGELGVAAFKLQLARRELLLEVDQFPFAGVECQALLCELLFGCLQFALSNGEIRDGGCVERVTVIEFQLPGREILLDSGDFLFAALQFCLVFVQFMATQFRGLSGSCKFAVEFGKFFLEDVGCESVFGRLFVEFQLSFQLFSASLLKFIQNPGNCSFRLLQFQFAPAQAGIGVRFCRDGVFGAGRGVLQRRTGLRVGRLWGLGSEQRRQPAEGHTRVSNELHDWRGRFNGFRCGIQVDTASAADPCCHHSLEPQCHASETDDVAFADACFAGDGEFVHPDTTASAANNKLTATIDQAAVCSLNPGDIQPNFVLLGRSAGVLAFTAKLPRMIAGAAQRNQQRFCGLVSFVG